MPTAANLQFAHMNDADAFSNLQALPIDFALAGDNVVISGIAKKRIYVYRIKFVVSGDTLITVKDGTSTNLSGPMTFLTGGALVTDISNVPWYQTSAGRDFILGSTQSVQVSGVVYYQQN